MTDNTSYDSMMDGDAGKFKPTSLSVEELLKPRYKVIADYPWSIYAGNGILNSDGESFHITTIKYFDEFGELVKSANWVDEKTVMLYPALFRKLNWWEDRDIKDLPAYVKRGDKVFNVKWHPVLKARNEGVYCYNLQKRVFPQTDEAYEPYINVRSCTPSTLEEYNQYNNLK